MLQTKVVRPGTFALLKNLMSVESVAGFNLAGGTALALQIGHRTSTDLDFFGNIDVPLDFVKQNVKTEFDFQIEHDTKNILIGFINGVKVDFVRYKYSLLEQPLIENGIRLLSIKDIGCMKLAAITGRGKKRDFYDLHFILKYIPLENLLEHYQKKYYDSSVQIVLKSLTYFEDAESDESPNLFLNTSWEMVKQNIEEEFRNYYNNL